MAVAVHENDVLGTSTQSILSILACIDTVAGAAVHIATDISSSEDSWTKDGQ